MTYSFFEVDESIGLMRKSKNFVKVMSQTCHIKLTTVVNCFFQTAECLFVCYETTPQCSQVPSF